MKRCLPLLVLGLLIVGCGDNLHPDDELAGASQGGEYDDDDNPAPRAIDADIFIETITCTETIARFEAGARYVDDNSTVFGIECLWRFDDGTTSTECVGEHLFDRSGAHDFVLEVTDPATGATDIATQTRIFAPPLELTLDVMSEDLTISYAATSNTGGEQVVFVSPDEFVIADDPNYPRTTNSTVRVTQAGTYTVTYDVEDERGVSEICSGQVVKTITVVCDGDGRVH
ncbi:MAG TPA: PKD domain-containing protein [Kofleriaceae bacterium]